MVSRGWGGGGEKKHHFLSSWPSKTFMRDVFIWRVHVCVCGDAVMRRWRLGSLKLDRPLRFGVCAGSVCESVPVKKKKSYLRFEMLRWHKAGEVWLPDAALLTSTKHQWRASNRDTDGKLEKKRLLQSHPVKRKRNESLPIMTDVNDMK